MSHGSGRWFVAVSLTLAALLALVGYWALRAVQAEANLLVALATALVVGAFVALVLLGRRVRKPEDDEPGFEMQK